mgnify:CR=1 FL=1
MLRNVSIVRRRAAHWSILNEVLSLNAQESSVLGGLGVMSVVPQ